MEKKLKISRILDYNDIPHVFIATDIVGTKFISLLVEDLGVSLHYIATAISSNRIGEYLSGSTDLRAIFESPEIQNFWFSIRKLESENFVAEHRPDLTILPEEYLPDTGYYYQKDIVQDKVLITESVAWDNVIVHFALDDGKGDNGIKANVLGDASLCFQAIIDNILKKTVSQMKGLKQDDKREFTMPRNSELRAFAASEGSFKIHFHATSDKNLFGEHIIEIALNKLDQVMSHSASDEEMITQLRTVKGHSVSSYKRLLNKVIKENVTIKYNWISPSTNTIHSGGITKDFAVRVNEILSQKQELTEEIKEFTGYVIGADVTTGDWKLVTEESDIINGESNGDVLKDVTLDTVRYRITCNEVIELHTVSEAEKKKYILITITEL